MRLMKEFELQGHTSVHGIEIDIENKAGSVRSGVDKDGHEWHTDMHYDYGYIVGAKGVDKDEVDVYVGPNPESEKVFIVHQNDPVTGVYDEDKVMLGFSSPEEAKIAYLSQYDRPGFFGTMDETDMETFQMAIVDPDKTEKKLGILWNRQMIALLNKGPDMNESSITISEEFQIPGTKIILEKGDLVQVKEERQIKLPLLTVVVWGGRVFGYSQEEVAALIDAPLDADNVPGWMKRAHIMCKDKKNSLSREIARQTLITQGTTEGSGIREILRIISEQGKAAFLNVNSELNYRSAAFSWISPL